MNTKMTVVVTAILVAVVLTATSYAQPADETKTNVKTFMRLKLKHAQDILEGLTVENFDQIAESSQEIRLLSQASQWQVLQTPEYVRRSTEFRRAVEAISAAAKDRNLDGATLGYVNVTMKCVECHKYVRSVRNAKLELPQDSAAGLSMYRRPSESETTLAQWLTRSR